MNFAHLKEFLGVKMISGVLRNALLVTVWKRDLTLYIQRAQLILKMSLQLIRFSVSALLYYVSS